MTAVERSTGAARSHPFQELHSTCPDIVLLLVFSEYECLQGVTDSPLPLFVLVGLFVDLDDLPLGVLLRPEDVGVGRGTHPAI